MVHGRSIFGECVEYKCWDENWYQKVIEEHKFIPSFENTYLANYATEKLFARFNLDIVTVLRDGGIYYTIRGIPTKSYVDADDFVSPKDLADFLMKVRKSKNAFIEYLTNKDRYLSVPINIVHTSAYCNLCAKLNNVKENRRSYNAIPGWFMPQPFVDELCPDRFKLLN